MTPRLAPSLRWASACLVGLVLVSAALGVAGQGAWLATAKVAILAFVFVRARRADAYALQWSSMLVLLFVAEGVVRATTDRWPSSALGALAAICATGYFVAALVHLRPLKRAARDARE